MSFNLNSDKIIIFPFGGNRPSDSLGRALSEQNIVRLVKSIVDIPSYVLEWNSSTNNIKFVIDGYYCECTLGDNKGPLFAGITLNSSGNYKYLAGSDDTDKKFTGVLFATTESELKECDATLHLLDDSGNVPSSSYRRFNSTSTSGSFSYKIINCGNSIDVF